MVSYGIQSNITRSYITGTGEERVKSKQINVKCVYSVRIYLYVHTIVKRKGVGAVIWLKKMNCPIGVKNGFEVKKLHDDIAYIERYVICTSSM